MLVPALFSVPLRDFVNFLMALPGTADLCLSSGRPSAAHVHKVQPY